MRGKFDNFPCATVTSVASPMSTYDNEILRMVNLNALRLCLLVGGLGLLAGCAPKLHSSATEHETAPQPPRVSEREDVCGAQRVQDRIGRQHDEGLAESIRQESGAAVLRVIRPGHVYTMDYRSERINVHIDEGGVITSIGCG